MSTLPRFVWRGLVTDHLQLQMQSLQPDLSTQPCTSTDVPFMDSDVSVLNAALPDAMTAVAKLPSGRVSTGQTFNVSSTDAPGHVASSCLSTGRHGTGNISCSASLTWSGTLSIVGCDAKCKAKHDAAKARRHYEMELSAELRAQGKCIGTGRRGCGVFSPFVYYDLHQARLEKQIAHDPPDAHFGSIASPRPPAVKHLKALRRLSPLTYHLIHRYLQIVGLVSSVTTALNRASGARVAISKGDSAAASDLAMQLKAARSYGGRAARLLAGQRHLANRAAAQLRRIAGTPAKPSSSSAVDIGRLAASLVSEHAARADRLAAAALSAIGHGAMG